MFPSNNIIKGIDNNKIVKIIYIYNYKLYTPLNLWNIRTLYKFQFYLAI
jgi:hypothetical protein